MKKNLSTMLLLTTLLSLAIIGFQIFPLEAVARGCGGGSGGCGGGGGSGGSVIDPPPGQPFKDPITMPDLNPALGFVNVSLEAKIAL